MSKAISKKKRLIIHEKYKGKCAYCGLKIEYKKMHVDHIVPIYRGSTNADLEWYGKVKGTNKIENLNPSCPSCNISKSTFTLEEWRNELVLKIDRLREMVTNFRLVENHGLIKVAKKPVIFYFEKEVNHGRK